MGSLRARSGQEMSFLQINQEEELAFLRTRHERETNFLRRRQEQEINDLRERQKQETARVSESADALFAVKDPEEMQESVPAKAEKMHAIDYPVEDERMSGVTSSVEEKNIDEIAVPTRKRARQQDALQTTVTTDDQHYSSLAARVQTLQAEVLRQKAIISDHEFQRTNAVKILKGLQCPDGYFRQAYEIRTKDLSVDDFFGTAVAIFEGTMAVLTTLIHSQTTINNTMRGSAMIGFPALGPHAYPVPLMHPAQANAATSPAQGLQGPTQTAGGQNAGY
jgi:hypothetical protein